MTESVLGNRYQVEARIGAGGMAEVYRGFDPILNRTVAVKVLLPQFARDTSFVQRFRREAQAAARLNQPNIVGVYDTGSGRRHPVHRHGVRRRPDAGRVHGDGPSAHPRAIRRDRPEDLRRAQCRPRGRGDPPRHQARQRHGDARGHREGHGLRHRARAGSRDGPADVGGTRHGVLSVSGTGAGLARRRAHRHLLAGRRALRDAHRTAAVHGRHAGRRRVQAGQRNARRSLAAELRRTAATGRRGHEGAVEEPLEPLPDGGRVQRRPGTSDQGPGCRGDAAARRRGCGCGDPGDQPAPAHRGVAPHRRAGGVGSQGVARHPDRRSSWSPSSVPLATCWSAASPAATTTTPRSSSSTTEEIPTWPRSRISSPRT